MCTILSSEQTIDKSPQIISRQFNAIMSICLCCVGICCKGLWKESTREITCQFRRVVNVCIGPIDIACAQWRSQKFVMEGFLAPFPSPLYLPPLPFSLPLPFLPLEVGPLKSS